MTDYRKGQKVLMTIALEDGYQDFLELDVLANGVLLGESVIFRDGRLTLVGIGTADGVEYHTRDEVIQTKPNVLKIAGHIVYFKETGEKDPLPWNAKTFKYPIVKVKRAHKPNRFI